MTERVAPSGVIYYEAQAAGDHRRPARRPTRRSWTSRRTSRTSRQLFNGPFPFTTNGVDHRPPDARASTRRCRPRSRSRAAASASARSTTRTCTSGGATTSPRTRTSAPSSRRATRTCREGYSTARTGGQRRRRPRARRPVTRRSRRSLVDALQHHLQLDQRRLWNVAPSNPTQREPVRQRTTYTRPGTLLHRAARDPRQGQLRRGQQGDPDARTAAARSPQPQQIAESTRSRCRTSAPACHEQARRVLPAVVGHGLHRLPGGRQQAADHGPGPRRPRLLRRQRRLRGLRRRRARRRRRDGAGDAALTLGAAGHVRHVHAGRGEDLHGVHDGERDLDRGRRDAERRPERERPATWSTARSRCRSRSAGLGVLEVRPGTAPVVQRRRSTITFKQRIGATDALRTGAYSKTLTFTLSTTTP